MDFELVEEWVLINLAVLCVCGCFVWLGGSTVPVIGMIKKYIVYYFIITFR